MWESPAYIKFEAIVEYNVVETGNENGLGPRALS